MKASMIAIWVGIGLIVFYLTSSKQTVAATPLGTLLGAGGGTAVTPAGTTPAINPAPPPIPGAGAVMIDVTPPPVLLAPTSVTSGPAGTVSADPLSPDQPSDPVLERCIVASANGLNQFPLPAECGKYGFWSA